MKIPNFYRLSFSPETLTAISKLTEDTDKVWDGDIIVDETGRVLYMEMIGTDADGNITTHHFPIKIIS